MIRVPPPEIPHCSRHHLRRQPASLHGQVLFNVVDGGLRPDEPESAPLRYKRLFTSCWHEWPENRWIRAAAAGAPPPLLGLPRAVHQRL